MKRSAALAIVPLLVLGACMKDSAEDASLNNDLNLAGQTAAPLDSVSAAERKSFSETSATSTRDSSSDFRSVCPRGASESWGATRTPRILSPERSNSSTERTPSATKSECFSRAFLRLKSRASVRSFTRGLCGAQLEWDLPPRLFGISSLEHQ